MFKLLLPFMFFVASVYGMPTNATATPKKETGGNESWIVMVTNGNRTKLKNALRKVSQSKLMSLQSSVVDDNPDSFNAFTVTGDNATVHEQFGDFVIAKNVKGKLFGGRRGQHDKCEECEKENWGLKRIADRQDEYVYPNSAGAKAVVYIVDSGIDSNHPEFATSIRSSKSFSDNTPTENSGDPIGHGTHVAGIIASKRFGVAPKVALINVPVVNADESFETVNLIKALQWVMADAKEHGKPAVVNLSLGGPANKAMDSAVEALHNAGIHVVIAANEHQNACNTSPARSDKALTVAASNILNELSDFSNFGRCVDIIAPGEDILSLAPNNGFRVMSGTSMATPFVAGVLGLILTEKTFANVDETYTYVKNISIKDKIKDLNSATDNKFLFNGIKPECTKTVCSIS